MNYHFDDFSEKHYGELLKIAKSNYTFITYDKYKVEGKSILWRHDVDLSIHRALKLAKMEAEEGVIATYFVNIHSEFYNLLEKEITDIVREILALGHNLGVHFDPNYYSLSSDNITVKKGLAIEKNLLEQIFDVNIKVFSFHNPEKGNSLKIDEDLIGGMINTYSKYFKENYGYVSDSNGYWRFRRLKDVLEDAKEEKLQVLTHPGWYLTDIKTPRERVQRAVYGRAEKVMREYDLLLKNMSRENI